MKILPSPVWLFLFLCLLSVGCQPPEPAEPATSEAAQPAKPGLLQGLADKVADKVAEKAAAAQEENLQQWDRVIRSMGDQLDLDDRQRQQLEQVAQEHLSDLKSWLGGQGAELARMEQQLFAAAKSRDLEKLRAAKDQATELRDQLAEKLNSFETAVRLVLGEEKTTRWQGQQLAQRAFDLYDEIPFTDQQRKRLAQLALETAQSVRDQANPQAAGLLELEKRIAAQVLTDEQTDAFTRIQQANPMRSLTSWRLFDSPE